MSESVEQKLRNALGSKIQDLSVRSPRRIYVEVAPEDMTEVVRCIFKDLRARFAISSGLQVPDGFEVLHHFAFDAEHVVLSVRVKTVGDPPELDSITPIIKGAEFIEREMHDLLGIGFRGHPLMKRLILDDEWPEGVYPLRRGRPWEGKVAKEL